MSDFKVGQRLQKRFNNRIYTIVGVKKVGDTNFILRLENGMEVTAKELGNFRLLPKEVSYGRQNTVATAGSARSATTAGKRRRKSK